MNSPFPVQAATSFGYSRAEFLWGRIALTILKYTWQEVEKVLYVPKLANVRFCNLLMLWCLKVGFSTALIPYLLYYIQHCYCVTRYSYQALVFWFVKPESVRSWKVPARKSGKNKNLNCQLFNDSLLIMQHYIAGYAY